MRVQRSSARSRLVSMVTKRRYESWDNEPKKVDYLRI